MSGLRPIIAAWLYRVPRLYALLLEFRSFLGHIQTVRERRLWESGVDLGPALETQPSGHLGPCIRTRACIRDRQRVHESHPWGSPVDLLLFLEGWDRGAEFGRRHACSPRIGSR